MLPNRGIVYRYGIAIISVAAAVLLRFALSGYLGNNVLLITFYPAVMVAALWGGFGPGIFATLLCTAIADYWLFHPNMGFAVKSLGDIVTLSLFIFMGVFMTVISGLYRVSRDKTIILEKELIKSESDKRLGILADTASQLLLTDNPQGQVQSLCENVMTELKCHTFFNFLVDEKRNCLHLNAFAGIPEETAKSIEWLDYGVAVCGCAARDGLRIIAEDIFHTPDSRTELVKSFGIQAYACHPLLGEEGRVIGTLSFGSRTKSHFSDDDIALMKAVTDHVATAMERMRLLTEAQKHAEEATRNEERLRLAQRVARIGTFELDIQTGQSKWTQELEEMYGLQPGGFVGTLEMWENMLHPDDRDEAVRQIGVAKETGLFDSEFRIILPNGTIRWLAGSAWLFKDDSGKPIRLLGVNIDITDRKHHEQHEREIESQKREFYKHTIMAATEGKLIILEREEIEAMAGESCASWNLQSFKDVAILRDSVSSFARDAGMSDERVLEFIGGAVESAGNAVKHTGNGQAQLYRKDDSLLLAISDSGSGIGAMSLPDVALTRGYSTAGTLGMGYKLMIEFSDKVYLATDTEGTTVAIEKKIQEAPLSSEYDLAKLMDL